MSNLVDIYGLDFEPKNFAISNEFMQMASKVCYTLGKNLKPFAIFAKDYQRKAGVLDFAQLGGIADESKTMVQEIVSIWAPFLETQGYSVDIGDPVEIKQMFYDYLLSTSICYIEIPKYAKMRDGSGHNTYDKYLATKNMKLLALWLGMSEEECQAKYSAKVKYIAGEYDEHLIRFVKPTYSVQKGNGVSTIRKAVDVTKMSCIPICMTYAFMQGFKSILDTDLLEFTYKKDAGEDRVLVSTLNRDLIAKYYDAEFADKVMRNTDIGSVNQGGMMLPQNVTRGYARLPEFGASIYDETGVRALNVSRVYKIRKLSVEDVNMSYIRVDLDNVFNTLYKYLGNITDYEKLYKAYVQLTGNDKVMNPSIESLVSMFYNYIDTYKFIMGTSLRKRVHDMMISNPEIFPNYTGLKISAFQSSVSTPEVPTGFVDL